MNLRNGAPQKCMIFCCSLSELLVFMFSCCSVYKDHITLEDYEIHDGMGLEL